MSSLPSTARPSGAELLRTIAAGTAADVGTAFLHSLVRHVAEALDVELVFVAEVDPGGRQQATVLASFGRDGVDLAEGEEFEIPGAPSTARHRLEGYLAIVLSGSDGARLGYLGVMSSSDLAPGEEVLAVLRIFAARAGAEIERCRQEVELRRREEELARSRARLVSVADEERRQIGRNLHDGAQQRMIVLGHRIALAQRKLEQSPEEAAEHLRHAGEEARTAGAELRELARGLHPAGLAEYGLEPALSALGGRSALPLDVVSLPDRRLPEVAEVSIYYLVSEALSNAVKYSEATRVRVEVAQRSDRVVVEVSDDGCGGADPAAGSGLRGLAERLDALGGTLEITSPAGEGTRLRAVLPLGPWRTARDPFLEFGHADDDGLGAKLIAQILSGEKTATISLAREWELEGGTPKIGQRLPVVDHHGRRHGIVEVIRIAVMPFGDVDTGTVQEHDPDASGVAEWRERQLAYYNRCREQIATLLGEPGWRLTESEPLVVLRFRVVEP